MLATAAPPPAIPVPGPVADLAARPDGSVLAAVFTPVGTGDALRLRPALRRLDASGTLSPDVPPTDEPASLARRGSSVAIGPDGTATVAYGIPAEAPDIGRVVVRTLTVGAPPGPEQVVSAPGVPAVLPDRVVAGPTGATAITYSGSGRNGGAWLAFRPAGATAFAPPVRLGRSADTDGRIQRVVLGPDGGGAILGLPNDEFDPHPFTLRRLSAAGQVGRQVRVPFGRHQTGGAGAAFTPAGTLALVLGSLDFSKGSGDARTRTVQTSLPAGSARLRPLRTIAGPASADLDSFGLGDSGSIDLVATGRDRVAYAASAGRGLLGLWEGRPGRVRRTTTIEARAPQNEHLVPLPGGGLAALWLGVATRSTDVRLFVARRASAAARFGATAEMPGYPADPKAAGFSSSADSFAHVAGSADGRLVAAYTPESASGEPQPGLLLTQPAP